MLVVDGPGLPQTGSHIAGLLMRPDPANSRPLDPDRLDVLQQDSRFRGICLPLERATAEAEELERRGIPLDVEMRPADFPALLRLAERLPGLRLAIGHLARPAFHLRPTPEWLSGMEAAARLPQVFCKISGLLTQVELPWKAAPIQHFVQYALAVFGPQRLMFGSEWPVRLPDVTWKESLAVFTQSIGARSMEEREQLLGGTARLFYAIE